MSKKGRRRRTPEQRLIARETRSRYAQAKRENDYSSFERWLRRMGWRG